MVAGCTAVRELLVAPNVGLQVVVECTTECQDRVSELALGQVVLGRPEGSVSCAQEGLCHSCSAPKADSLVDVTEGAAHEVVDQPCRCSELLTLRPGDADLVLQGESALEADVDRRNLARCRDVNLVDVVQDRSVLVVHLDASARQSDARVRGAESGNFSLGRRRRRLC